MALASLVTAGALEAQSPSGDPILGVWKLNVARSVWSPGPRAPEDWVDLREFAAVDGGWIRYTQSGANVQGAPAMQFGIFKVDGQRHPVYNFNMLTQLTAGGQATTQTRSYRRIDARTTEFTTYNSGVPGLPSTRSVSADGTTYVQLTQGTNAQGIQISNVLLYERVR